MPCCAVSGIVYQDFIAQADIQHILRPHAALLQSLQALSTFAQLYNALKHRRQAAQLAANAIVKDFRLSLAAAHRKRWHRLWYSCRKAAYAQIFAADHDDRGSKPAEILAVRYPLHAFAVLSPVLPCKPCISIMLACPAQMCLQHSKSFRGNTMSTMHSACKVKAMICLYMAT